MHDSRAGIAIEQIGMPVSARFDEALRAWRSVVCHLLAVTEDDDWPKINTPVGAAYNVAKLLKSVATLPGAPSPKNNFKFCADIAATLCDRSNISFSYVSKAPSKSLGFAMIAIACAQATRSAVWEWP